MKWKGKEFKEEPPKLKFVLFPKFCEECYSWFWLEKAWVQCVFIPPFFGSGIEKEWTCKECFKGLKGKE